MTDTELREPYFTFDVWQCKKCGNVVTDTAYMQFAVDFVCPCRRAVMSEYRFVKAKLDRAALTTLKGNE